ncbi:MAG: glycoside hydrolase family 38 N-terminal domain-containing protein [Armatimonadota bacterium]
MPNLNELTRPWEIWLVHHTHVDIGYTEPQDIILRKHAEFVAQALDFCTATDALPPGERFCWTCEVAWTVKAFLVRYPERATEFFRRVREGRIEVTALYLQLTDLFTQELLEETTDYALALSRMHDFTVVTAMNDDVNGWAWGLPDLLATRGVRYLDTAINETRALGVRPRPAMFRWTGPQGGNVLFWHSNGYLHGNGLAFHLPDAEQRVAGYLKGLEDGDYPHHVIEVRIHGENHDNAPPGLWISQLVHEWNSRHALPKLRLVTPRVWFEEVATRWPAPITEHRAGWPDWWADGNGSAAAESALVREAQADLLTLNALATATGLLPPADRLERVREAAAFFCEHTWGAWCSTDAPDSLTSRSQWNTKAGFAYTAAIEARSLLQDACAAESHRQAGDEPGVLVFNPADQQRSDIAQLVIADADLGLATAGWVPAPIRTDAGPALHLVDAETGTAIPVLREPAIADSARRPGQLVRFLARDVPARGFRHYRVAAGDMPATTRCDVHDGILTSPAVEVCPAADGAGIASIRDLRSGGHWLRKDADFALGEVIYETIPGPYGREKLCGWDGIKQDCPFERTRVRFDHEVTVALPYGKALRFRAGALPGSLRSLTLDVLVYDDLPRVDLCYQLEKVPNPEAEALYIAFPLAGGAHPEVWLDVPGAAMRPGHDQVPGTATDWHSVQHYFAVSGSQQTVVVASPDIPLVQVNGINTGQWQQTLPEANGTVMSWVMNNYWFTNFPAAQGGGFTWRYSLLAMPGGFDRDAATRFARTLRQPLIASLSSTRWLNPEIISA